MEKYLLRIKPKYYGVVAFLITCVATYVMLSYEQVLSTGIYVFIEGDTLTQFVPFVKMFYNDLLSGKGLWYSWSMSMGQNAALTYAFYVWNPFHLLYVIFPFLDEAVVTTMIFILKTGLAALFFQRFSVKVLKCDGIGSIVFSVFYAMCSYNVIFNVLMIMWTDALYLLPLICTQIYCLVRERKWKGLLLSYTFLFLTQTYMAYLVGIVTFGYMLILWLLYSERGRRAAVILLYAFCVILALGLSAFALVPAVQFLISNNGQSVAEFDSLKANLFDILFNLSWGQMQGVEGVYPYIYCGIPAVILCVMYFLNKKIRKKEKIVAGTAIVFLIGSMLLMPLYQFMHAFDSPDMLGFRFAFLLSFVLCSIACRQAGFIKEFSVKHFITVILGILAVFIILFMIQAKNDLHIESDLFVTAIGNILLLAVWVLVFIFGIKKGKNQVLVALLVIALTALEVVSNGYATYMVMGADGTERQYNTYKDSIEKGLQFIEDDGFYRVRYLNDYISNSDSWFGYNGISDFSSARNVVLQETMTLLGHYSCRNMILDYGHTPVTDMLFGVKYTIEGIHPNMLATHMPEPIVYTNDKALELGYMTDSGVLDYEFDSLNVFDNMDRLLQAVTGEYIECFENVSADNVVMLTENAWYEVTPDGTAVGHGTETDKEGYIYYQIPYEEGKTAYVQFQTPQSEPIMNAPVLMYGEENNVNINGYLTVSYAKPLIENNGTMEVTVQIAPDSMPVARYQQANFCYFNNEELTKAYNILSQNQMVIKEYGNTYIDAAVTVPEDKTVLFTSIPYDKGWTVYVDGTERETKAVVGDAFLALELTPGYHDLEFRYEAPGVAAGMTVSGVSLVVGCGFILADYRKRKKQRKEN